MVNGVSAVFVECRKGGLPEAGRALGAWHKLEVQGEGVAIPWEGVGAIAHWMAKQPTKKHRIAADVCLIAADCYLRKNDWSKLLHDDVVWSEDLGVALLLGVPERGETTKTGVRQGVRPDRKGVQDLIMKYYNRTGPGQPLFNLSVSNLILSGSLRVNILNMMLALHIP